MAAGSPVHVRPPEPGRLAAALFLHSQGYPSGPGRWSVDRAIPLDLAAYLFWALFGIRFGALIRNQLAATVSATVLHFIGVTAGGTLFDLLHT